MSGAGSAAPTVQLQQRPASSSSVVAPTPTSTHAAVAVYDSGVQCTVHAPPGIIQTDSPYLCLPLREWGVGVVRGSQVPHTSHTFPAALRRRIHSFLDIRDAVRVMAVSSECALAIHAPLSPLCPTQSALAATSKQTMQDWESGMPEWWEMMWRVHVKQQAFSSGEVAGEGRLADRVTSAMLQCMQGDGPPITAEEATLPDGTRLSTAGHMGRYRAMSDGDGYSWYDVRRRMPRMPGLASWRQVVWSHQPESQGELAQGESGGTFQGALVHRGKRLLHNKAAGRRAQAAARRRRGRG